MSIISGPERRWNSHLYSESIKILVGVTFRSKRSYSQNQNSKLSILSILSIKVLVGVTFRSKRSYSYSGIRSIERTLDTPCFAIKHAGLTTVSKYAARPWIYSYVFYRTRFEIDTGCFNRKKTNKQTKNRRTRKKIHVVVRERQAMPLFVLLSLVCYSHA